MAGIAVEVRRDMVTQRPSRPEPPAATTILTRAETAECNCPDACERDHEND
jgi:hypothetical protein